LDEWSRWILEGQYVKYRIEDTIYYAEVAARDFAHWEYTWSESVSPGSMSGPVRLDDLEITKKNHLWQLIFGIKGQVYVYIELPTDIHRHGIPKVPKPSTTTPETSHFTEEMSPYAEPSFITEHYMMRPVNTFVAISVYNPTQNNISITPKFNFWINKMILNPIGSGPVDSAPVASQPHLADLLDKLYRRVVPCKPITLQPVRAPAEAPAGE
jgi:hypothetical protein